MKMKKGLMILFVSALFLCPSNMVLSAGSNGAERKIDAKTHQKLDRGDSHLNVIVLLTEYRNYIGKIRADQRPDMAKKHAFIHSQQNTVLNKVRPSHLALKHRFENVAGFSARVSREGIRKLADLPEVAIIEEDEMVEAHTAQGAPLIQASSPRSLYNGTGVSIAIVDTGIDYSHPMLGGGYFPNDKVIGGYDFGDDDPDPSDCQGHGTAVAGIAAGTLAAGEGDYIGGIAHNAKLYALKIVPGCTGGALTSDIIAAWDWAVSHKNDDPDNPILVINTSFGGGKYLSACDGDQPALAAAADNAAANGITIFSSSGNNAYIDGIAFPACVSNSISVGAVYDADVGSHEYGNCTDITSAADKVTCYSNSADFLDILAPSNDACTTFIGGYTSSFGGTSAASPYAAGVGALVQSYAKAVTGSYFSPGELKARLLNGDQITDPRNNITKPRLNTANTLYFSISKADVKPVIDGDISEFSGTDAITFSSPSGGNTVTVRALLDDEALYLSFEVSDTQLNATVTTRDGAVRGDDSVEWGIDTLNDDGGPGDPDSPFMLPDDYHGIVNILNTQYDSRGADSGAPSPAWDGSWESAVRITGTNNENADSDAGYAVEIKIPWTSIGYSAPPGGTSMVRMGFALNDRDTASYNSELWPAGAGDIFENASNWQQLLLSSNHLPAAGPGGPYAGMEGESLLLDGSGSGDVDGAIVLYEWDIDNDGLYDYASSSSTQSHTYDRQGTYTITLKVTDNNGATRESATTAFISDTSPSAEFTAAPANGWTPLLVDFIDNSGGHDQPFTYEWDFDNDGTVDSTDRLPSHIYTNAGTYTVKLTITDSDGDISTATKTDYITVGQSVYIDVSGICWGNSPCFPTIQEAINASGDGTLIKIPGGTYYENIFMDIAVTGLTLQGGWSSNYKTRSKDPSLTIIDGDMTGDGIGDGPVFDILASGLNTGVTIEGLTITNGVESGVSAGAANSGVLTLALKGDIIKDNKASSGGGVRIFSDSDGHINAALANDIITGNTADGYGGGISVLSEDGPVYLTLINNTVTNNSSAAGGGISVFSRGGGNATADILNTIVWRNTGAGNGDDIYVNEDDSSGDASTIVSASHSDIGEVSADNGAYNNGPNLNTDPLFVDSANGDYHILQSSPLVDGGTNAGGPPDDFEGDIRPFNGKYYGQAVADIGADEYADKWTYIAASSYHTVALKSDGTLWAWGGNSEGQLGDGTTTPNNTPTLIGTDNTWTSIATGYGHTIALKSDGTLWAWGLNCAGQLGDCSCDDKLVPTRIGADNTWVSVAAGSVHSLALKADGSLWAWGHNDFGQLGDGTNAGKTVPSRIGNENTWSSIAAREDHTMALKSDGSLWAWGSNSYGQLGDGTYTAKNTPVQIGADYTWAFIAAGGNHSAALKSDGTLWAWGSNSYGQLGDGTYTGKNTPAQIGTDNTWVSVAAGTGYTIALKSDGTLWAWGSNSYGQLGQGATISSNYPVIIGHDNTWISISAGYWSTAALKSDGTLWAWGNNLNGQLGDGTYDHRYSPVQITYLPIAAPGGPYSGIEGQTITLDGSGSVHLDGPIALYEWDVNNDGTYDYASVLPTQNHMYSQQGLYSIKLRVTDNLGANTEDTTAAYISDTSPSAEFTGYPTDGTAPLTVNFTDSSTGYDQPLSCEWDFDNDGTTDSTSHNPSVIYADSGTYSVSLKVTDADGSVNTLTRTSYISTCASPARIQGSPAAYSSLQEAYDAAGDGEVILSQDRSFTETLVLDRDITIYLQGGYDCEYTGVTGKTNINGTITINNGKVIIANIILQ